MTVNEKLQLIGLLDLYKQELVGNGGDDMQSMRKPKIDEVTGCAHITNLDTYKHFRICSNCMSEMPEEICEEQINFCWRCGIQFDHTDDDPDSKGR